MLYSKKRLLTIFLCYTESTRISCGRSGGRPAIFPEEILNVSEIVEVPPSPERKNDKPRMAKLTDRYVLYEDAVQAADAEIDFVDETFTQLRGRKAKWLREDFCGTANTACEWVRRRKTNHAIGIDLDADVQQWGRETTLRTLALPETVSNSSTPTFLQ